MKILYFLILIIIQGLFTTFSNPDKDYITETENQSDFITDSTFLYARCGSMLFTSGKKGIFYSDDQGVSWKKQNNFPDVKAVKISSRDTELFVLTDHYGLYYSIDCGKTWETIEQIFEADEGMSMSESNQLPEE
ncbi:MAG: exo-alpha-sialidase [Bacteroidetes bacterium]|nr:exo-alpha-sialidase [Bacteroidota bacterium]